MKIFNINKIDVIHFNKIKAFIFPPFQLPTLNKKKSYKYQVFKKQV